MILTSFGIKTLFVQQRETRVLYKDNKNSKHNKNLKKKKASNVSATDFNADFFSNT